MASNRLNAQIVKEWLKTNQHTYDWLAKKLGVCSNAIRKWMSGERFPGATNLLDLSDQIGVEPRELILPKNDDKRPA